MDKTIKQLKKLYKKNRNWEEVSNNIETVVSSFDYYICQPIEYNTDTSVRHLEISDDIVQTASNKEDVELQNKESVR